MSELDIRDGGDILTGDIIFHNGYSVTSSSRPSCRLSTASTANKYPSIRWQIDLIVKIPEAELHASG